MSSKYDILFFIIVIQCKRFRQVKYIQSKIKNKSMVADMLNNLRYKYYSHNNNIKYVSLTIKCIDFESITYVINLVVVLSSIIFKDFDFMFPSMYR